jgi:hypothetical protein
VRRLSRSASPFRKCSSASGDFEVAVIVVALDVAAVPAADVDEDGGGDVQAVKVAAAMTKSTRFMWFLHAQERSWGVCDMHGNPAHRSTRMATGLTPLAADGLVAQVDRPVKRPGGHTC